MSTIKKDNKTVKIIILLAISVILAIILCVLHIVSTLKDNDIISNTSSNIKTEIKNNPKNYTIEEILEAHECKLISFSVEGKDTKYYEIYLKFRYKLYESKESKEEYFETLLDDLIEKVGISFYLIDESKNIDIYYDSKTKIYKINGIEDFYNNNSYNEVMYHKATKPVEAFRSATELNRLIQNSWNRHELNLDAEPNSIDSEWIYYDGYKINYTDININYIMFMKDYEEAIIEGIKVGEEFSKIKDILGQPNYKNSNKMIGYKTTDGYVFFYDDYIVLYPYIDYINIDLEKLILEYYDKEYEGYRTNFILDVKNECPDFISEIVNDGVKLYSPSRGIDLYLPDDGSIDITIYDNYRMYNSIKRLAQTNRVELNFENDSIYLYEIERYSK